MMDIQFILAGSQSVLADSSIGCGLYSISDLLDGKTDKTLTVPKAYHHILAKNVTIVLTNTFDTNRLCLSMLGRENDTTPVNERAAEWLRTATESFRGNVVVAGTIGYNGFNVSLDELQDVYTEQAQALVDGGVDCFWLESFPSLGTVTAALRACRTVAPDLPVIATIAPSLNSTDASFDPLTIAFHLQQEGIAAIGIDVGVRNTYNDDCIEDSLIALNLFLKEMSLGGIINTRTVAQTGKSTHASIASIAHKLMNAGAQIFGLGQDGNAEQLSILAEMLGTNTAAIQLEPTLAE